MKAYAVLDGGGVKGAALAGCLKGAEQVGVEFVGYGGTSAGSMVALLASIGYSPDEMLGVMCEELDFAELLDDNGVELSRWNDVISEVSAAETTCGRFLTAGRNWWSHRSRLWQVLAANGVYSGQRLEIKLKELIVRKHRCFENARQLLLLT